MLKDGKVNYMAAGPTADFDRDGRLDVFLCSWWPQKPSLLLRNETEGGHWLQVAVLTANDSDARGDVFGGSVTLSGDGNVLFVGAKKKDSSGAVYAFRPVNESNYLSDWVRVSKIVPETIGTNFDFGDDCACSADGLCKRLRPAAAASIRGDDWSPSSSCPGRHRGSSLPHSSRSFTSLFYGSLCREHRPRLG